MTLLNDCYRCSELPVWKTQHSVTVKPRFLNYTFLFGYHRLSQNFDPHFPLYHKRAISTAVFLPSAPRDPPSRYRSYPRWLVGARRFPGPPRARDALPRRLPGCCTVPGQATTPCHDGDDDDDDASARTYLTRRPHRRVLSRFLGPGGVRCRQFLAICRQRRLPQRRAAFRTVAR